VSSAAASPDWNCPWAHPGAGARIAYTRVMSEHRCFRKKETKYSYNAFQARDRRDKSECDSAVYSSLHGIQGCHLVFFDFLNTKNAQKYPSFLIWQPRWNIISPVIFAGALKVFAGALVTGPVVRQNNTLLTRQLTVTNSAKKTALACKFNADILDAGLPIT